MAKAKRKRKSKKPVEQVESIYTHATDFAAEALFTGNSEVVIAERLHEQWPVFTPANIQFIIHRASKQIASEFHRDSKSIVSLHVKRYDQEIEKLLNKKYEGLVDEDEEDEVGDNAMKKRKMRIAALMWVLEVMTQKERVLQLHTKTNQVKVFNKLNAKVKEKKVLFDLNDLSLVEKIEFLKLIERAKKNDNELYSITASKEVAQVTEDISHEEIVNNNINEVKLINQPEPKKVKVQKGLNDITAKLHAALAKKAEQEFKKKNGGGGGPQAIDYTEINNV